MVDWIPLTRDWRNSPAPAPWRTWIYSLKTKAFHYFPRKHLKVLDRHDFDHLPTYFPMTTLGTISAILSFRDQPTPFFNLNFLLQSIHELPNSPISHRGGGCFHKVSHTGVLGVVFTLIWNLSCFPGLGTKRVIYLVLQSVWVANILFQVLQCEVPMWPVPMWPFLCHVGNLPLQLEGGEKGRIFFLCSSLALPQLGKPW